MKLIEEEGDDTQTREDIRSVGNYEIEVTKVTPIKVLTREEYKKLQEEKANG